MNYTEAIKYIEEKNKLGIVPGLDSIKELLKRLGNPENKCKALHIAGTNGKGSVFAFAESALIEAGYKIGRYIYRLRYLPILKDFRLIRNTCPKKHLPKLWIRFRKR